MRASSPENITMSCPVVISWSRMNLMDTSVAPDARALRRWRCISCHSPFDSLAHRVPSAFALQLGMGSAGVGYKESSPGSPGGVAFSGLLRALPPSPAMASPNRRSKMLTRFLPCWQNIFAFLSSEPSAGWRRRDTRENNMIIEHVHNTRLTDSELTRHERMFFPMISRVGALE